MYKKKRLGKNPYLWYKKEKEMVTVIKKGTSLEAIKKKIDYFFSKTPSKNIRKYAGKLKTDINPLEYQRELRNEWE